MGASKSSGNCTYRPVRVSARSLRAVVSGDFCVLSRVVPGAGVVTPTCSGQMFVVLSIISPVVM
jgi:hypothetical protein